MKFCTSIVLTAFLCLPFANLVCSAEQSTSPITPSFTIKQTFEVANIDGKLTESLWHNANKITQFHQVAPVEFGEPAEKTEVYVTYNQDYLYIGAKLYDANMNSVLHKVIVPGQNIFSDDHFMLILDTFNDGSNGYLFATNANSYKEDALLVNNNSRISDWNGVWFVETKMHSDHWTVEIAIPFKTINFDPKLNQWGINFLRELKDPQQTIAWSSHGKTLNPWGVEYAGNVNDLVTTGKNAITQGVGLDVKLSLTGNQQRDHDTYVNSNETKPSVDIFYKPTPKITTSLTFNTDFSATEIDEQQVNLSRFSLYTPEKRDFFLQDAGIFEFGKQSYNGTAFFSRQIGLDTNGTPLKINAGVKVAGQQNKLSFGVLGINQEQLNGENKNLLVARAKYNINDELTTGAIVTKGSPILGENNQVVGSDFIFRNSTWLKGDIVELSGWVQSSKTDYDSALLNTTDNDHNNSAYGLTVSTPNDDLFSEFKFTEIQNNFNPALGFVNRVGIRQYDISVSVESPIKSGWLSWIYHSLYATKVTNMDNQTESQSAALILFETLDKKENYFQCQLMYQYERVEQAFEVLPNLIVTDGDHNFNNVSCGAYAGETYSVSGSLSISKGDFFQGTSNVIDMSLSSNLNEFVRVEFNYGVNKVVLDDNQFDLNLVSAKLDIAFSPNLYWNNWFQYNNVDETLGVFSRLRWKYSPLNQLDFVVNQRYLDTVNTSNWVTRQQDIALKVSYTLRY